MASEGEMRWGGEGEGQWRRWKSGGVVSSAVIVGNGGEVVEV